MTSGPGRRAVLGGSLLAAGGAAGYGAAQLASPAADAEASSAELHVEAFRGPHQGGIVTPAQDQLLVAAFDVSIADRDLLVGLLQDWSTAAEQMAAGELVGGEPYADPLRPPKDTGEAWGYDPSRLTVTLGFGARLFRDAKGEDRFGLADRMPAVLADGVPRFGNETLRARESDGDVLVQICGDDSQVCVHALRNLTRIAFGRATLRWSQLGYGRTSSTSTAQDTPRNLFGYKDGTANLKAEEPPAELARHLWVQDGDDDGAGWMTGGCYVVMRKIRMFLEVWDRLALSEQDAAVGRDKRHGAPLSVREPTASDEMTAMDLGAKGAGGTPAIPVGAHVRVVHPDENGGVRMLRRGYNYTDGNDSLGRIDAGLFFITFVRDPRRQVYPLLQRMAREDALAEYLQHHASALFAVPPGLGRASRFAGEALFS